MIKSLEGKEANRDKVINHLKSERKLHLHDLLEEREHEMPIE